LNRLLWLHEHAAPAMQQHVATTYRFWLTQHTVPPSNWSQSVLDFKAGTICSDRPGSTFIARPWQCDTRQIEASAEKPGILIHRSPCALDV